MELTKVWSSNYKEAMSQLVESFPGILRSAPGARPWNATRFLGWVCSTAMSHGELLAARFVLGIWNSHTDWVAVAKEEGFEAPGAAERFDLFDAMAVWDSSYLFAMRRWIEHPFKP